MPTERTLTISKTQSLTRAIGWKTLTLYGLGNILGAGIYVLIGEVAGKAGSGLALAFLIAAVVATFTGISYSALAGAYPLSAGESVYIEKAFGRSFLSPIVGLMLVFSGIVSSSALLRGFYDYSQELITIERPLVIGVVVILLTLIAVRGIKQSAWMAVVLTLVEVAGLIVIVAVGFRNGSPAQAVESTIKLTDSSALGILFGSFLAFYAFIGFEDMVNIAEEVKQPRISMRRAILTALVLSTLLYIIVSIAVLSVTSPQDLSTSRAPLAHVYELATGSSWPLISVIGLFAIINGVLAQIIMSSRILYGLAKLKWLPQQLGRLHGTWHTPLAATILISAVVYIVSLSVSLSALAQITSLAILIIFTIVQVAAIRLIRAQHIKLHWLIPAAGILLNLSVIGLQLTQWVGVF